MQITSSSLGPRCVANGSLVFVLAATLAAGGCRGNDNTVTTAAPPATAAGAQAGVPTNIDPEAGRIAVEGYVYLYPLVLMDVTRRQATNVEAGKTPGRGPTNTFSHLRTFPSADFKDVVRPNFDTLYSPAWIDLVREPVIVSVPDTAGRYYLLPIYDMWTDVFAVPGTRTTGSAAGHFALVAPGWQGQLPAGVQRLNAPTPLVWIIGRTQTNGPADYGSVQKVQDGITATPLSQWGRAPQPVSVTVDPGIDMKTPPLEQVKQMAPAAFFHYAAELLKLHPTHATDQPILARMKRIGFEAGKNFDAAALPPALQQAYEKAPAEAMKAMLAKLPTLARVANGWQMNTETMGVYGNYYLKRAIMALVGLGANLPDDAVYPLNVADSGGKPLDGVNKYVMQFSKAELPPVGAFWSITMYHQGGFQAANPINRYAIGDRDALKYNPDGSLDIYIQNASPGAEKESNWLPAPKGPLGVTMRLYAPKPEVLDGRWNPPAVNRLQ